MPQNRNQHTRWTTLLWLLLHLPFLLQPCAAAEPRNLFTQFDQLLNEESFRQLHFVDTEDLLLGAGSPKELDLQFAQAPEVKIRELDIPAAGESKCLIVKLTAPNFAMNFALDCDEDQE